MQLIKNSRRKSRDPDTKSSGQTGEIILIILLVMAVGLTIGLAVASRSITDVRLSTQIEESSRAFSAAEAGIEEVLKSGLVGIGTTNLSGQTGGTYYNVQLNSLSASNNIFKFPTEIADGDAQTVWLVPQKADGSGPDDSGTGAYSSNSIRVCWANLGAASNPAVEISLLFKRPSDGVYRVAREGYDLDTRGGFSNPGGGNQCNFTESTTYQTLVNFNSFGGGIFQNGDIPIALRIRPVYAPTKIAVDAQGGGIIPEQGKNIVSTGQTNSGVERRWNVVQTFSSPNDIFDYAVWSKLNLTKN